MTLDEMKEIKKQRGYSNEQISELSGVPIGTVRKVFSGETKHPRFETMQALEKFFASPYKPNYPGPVYDFYPGKEPVLVKERNLDDYYYVERGAYTFEEFDHLRGESGRGELIDGVIYNLASPSVTHQMIQMRLSYALRRYVDEKGGDCIPMTATLDVHIDNDKYTILQPDVMVICDKDLIKDGTIWGAPDFVAEILSPSTAEKDLYLKLNKYCRAGVREYWIIDQEQNRVIVYDFAHHNMIHIYSFNDKIPVGIWDGDCVVDFAPIAAELEGING